MPVTGFAQFEREARAVRDEALELARRCLGEVAAYSHRRAVDDSPVADPDAPGSGRLRASWTMTRNQPDERFAPLPPAGGRVAPPTEQVTQAVADAVQLGDEIWITNGSPCVSTVNDRTSFIDGVVAATASKAEEVCARLSTREVSGARAIARGRS